MPGDGCKDCGRIPLARFHRRGVPSCRTYRALRRGRFVVPTDAAVVGAAVLSGGTVLRQGHGPRIHAYTTPSLLCCSSTFRSPRTGRRRRLTSITSTRSAPSSRSESRRKSLGTASARSGRATSSRSPVRGCASVIHATIAPRGAENAIATITQKILFLSYPTLLSHHCGRLPRPHHWLGLG